MPINLNKFNFKYNCLLNRPPSKKTKRKKKKRNQIINKRIDKKIINLFGKDHFESDKILMKNSINTLNKTKLYCEYYSDDTEISDDNNSSCFVEKIHSSKNILEIKKNSHINSFKEQNPDISHTKSPTNLHYSYDFDKKVSTENEKYVSIEIDKNVTKNIVPPPLEDFNIDSKKTNIPHSPTSINNNNIIISLFSPILENFNIQDISAITYSDENSDIEEMTLLQLQKARAIIEANNEIYKNIILEDLAVMFWKNNCLSNYSWISSESKLIKKLMIQLIEKLKDTNYNMANLSCCFVCIFHKISVKSSIPPNKMKLNFIKYLHVIKKIIYDTDKDIWRTWLLTYHFEDWCFLLASIFITKENDIHTTVNDNSPLVNNAMIYLNVIKKSNYTFNNITIAQSGIFEFSTNDDLLEIGDMCETRKKSKINTDESNSKILKIDNSSKPNQIKHKNVNNEICHSPLKPRISICAEFSLSNSFKNKIAVYGEVDDNQPNSNKSLDLIQPYSDINEEINLNNVQSLKSVNSSMTQNNVQTVANNISNNNSRSLVDESMRNTNISESNVNMQATSIVQEISTYRNNHPQIIMNSNKDLNIIYSNNFCNNSSTQPPSHPQIMPSLSINTQSNQNCNITSNNNTQSNVYNTIYHNNDINIVTNSSYNANNNSHNLQNTYLVHHESANLPSQRSPSFLTLPGYLNQYPENYSNTQLPPNNTISTAVPPPRLHSNINNAQKYFNQYTHTENYNNIQLPSNNIILTAVSPMLQINSNNAYEYLHPENYNNTQLPPISTISSPVHPNSYNALNALRTIAQCPSINFLPTNNNTQVIKISSN